MKENEDKAKISALKVAVISGVIGAIVGSCLTFLLPHVWTLFTLKPPTMNVTPEELETWYKKIDHPVQAQILAKDQYYGKWVHWQGTIGNITASNSDFAMLKVDKFYALCDSKDARTLNIGMRVAVLGRIYLIDDEKVVLDKCKVEIIQRQPPL